MTDFDSSTVKGVLFDLDGVLYVGDQVINGASETLRALRDRQVPYRFITNTSTRSASDVADKLASMGFNIAGQEIFSAVTATRDYLRQQGSPSVHLLIRED